MTIIITVSNFQKFPQEIILLCCTFYTNTLNTNKNHLQHMHTKINVQL